MPTHPLLPHTPQLAVRPDHPPTGNAVAQMKITLNWLKQYVDFSGSPEQLAEHLTMLGVEVEGIQKIGGNFDHIVVGHVITRDRHPNADRLSLCKVHDGTAERQIVCGAQNFKAGDKVPLALPGAVMPTAPGEPPFIIKVGKIRNCESQGMMCSGKELGLTADSDGLMILSPDARVGQPFSQYLGASGSDVVYDLEITPNRPDLNSVIGLAREISAVTGLPLRKPEIPPFPAAGTPTSSAVSIRIDDFELCPRYTARVIRGIQVGPSPDWLKQTLEKVGLRSINNVVDVTNYVMLETGQPLHAFDYHLLTNGTSGKPTIIVRHAAENEAFTTLDGQKRTLNSRMLLIADESKGTALAGIMGGQNSEIQSTTRDLLLESACFQPQNIRATSKALGLKTDASYRFERGADIGVCDWASQRAAQLIVQVAGGHVLDGSVDIQTDQQPARVITLRHSKVSELLGISIPTETQRQFLTQLDLKVLGSQGEDHTTFEVPSFRVDLKREHDLIEEVTRLFGIDKIPSTPPRGALGSHAHDSVHDQLGLAREILVSLGFNEAQGQTLISDQVAKHLAPESSITALAYPLSSDMNVLRPSLLGGLLDALRHNAHHQETEVALFEIGRVFTQNQGNITEERRLAIALTGLRNRAFWSGAERDAKQDIFDLKGAVEEFLERFGLKGVTYVRQENPSKLFVEAAQLQLGKLVLGQLGQLSPIVARQYDLRDPVFLAELQLDSLIQRRVDGRQFKPLPAFPSIRRDIAMVVPESVSNEKVLAAVKQLRPAHLESVELFDVFRGGNIPEGQKSIAYAFTYRAADKTLTDQEINTAHESLVNQFRNQLQATIR